MEAQEGLTSELPRPRHPATGARYSKTTASRWDNGRRVPSHRVVQCLADILRIDEELLLQAAGYDQPSTQLNDLGALIEGLREMANDIQESIGVTILTVVPAPSLELLNAGRREEAESVDTNQEYARGFPRLGAEKKALYDRFVRLTTSQQYRRSVRAWQESVAEYETLAKAGDAQTEEAYARARRGADQAVTELWNAVEAIRWGQ